MAGSVIQERTTELINGILVRLNTRGGVFEDGRTQAKIVILDLLPVRS